MFNPVNFNGQFKIYGTQGDVKEAVNKLQVENTKKGTPTHFLKTLDKTRVLDYVEGLVVTEDKNTPAYNAKDVLKNTFKVNA